MNEKKFDDIVKGKLNDLTPHGDQDAWLFFESKLDKAENSNIISDTEFDATIKDQLISSRHPYNSEHWRQLKSQLKTIEERKNTIFVSKILELAAIFLIFFTFSHLSGGYRDKQENNNIILPNEYAGASIKYKPLLPTEAKVSVIQKQNAKLKYNRRLFSSTKESVLSGTKKTILSEVTPHSITIVTENVYLNKTNVAVFAEVFSSDESDKSENITSDKTNNVAQLADLNPSDENVTFDGGVVSLENLPLIPIESELALSFPVIKSKVNRSSIFSLSAWAATDVNLINTPFDKFYSLASYKKEALNNSWGLNFSTKKSNIEFETGLGYSKRIYQPARITEAYGVFGENYFEKSLDKISYDVASIPINIKLHAMHNTGWSVYIMAGAALNIILNAEYDITETLVRGRPPVGRYVPDMARLDSKPFIRGMLRGDSFRDNYFATVGFGFGIEKRLFKNTSIYVQPSYFRQVLSSDIGIGPNKDKIHTSSLQVGIKTTL